MLASPDFDRAAVDAAFARTRDADRAVRTRLEETSTRFAESLTPRERETFVEGLKRTGRLRQQFPKAK